MSFYATSDNIRLTNTSGTEVFNTDWKMPAITSTVTGSRSMLQEVQVIQLQWLQTMI